jgi:MOSC domain-containing protein YiiM
MADNINEMKSHFPQTGELIWIGLRPVKKAEVKVVPYATVSTEAGLEGDHYHGNSGERHVTLIQAEHLDATASMLNKEKIDPKLTRRNLVIKGINILSFKDHRFQIGDQVVLEMTGLCHPCSRMEENLGYGGYNAIRGHAGITARVIQGGIIKTGDKVTALPINK